MKYIALLRGVNVGGKNMLSMRELKDEFERRGFSDVETYINSGNVIFRARETDEPAIRAACEALIEERFGIVTPVAVISAADLEEALANAPAWWGEDADAKHNAIFVLPPATAEQVSAEVGETKPEHEKVASFGRVIFWSAPIRTFSRTRWSKVVGTSAYRHITIRNERTARKLNELAGGAEPHLNPRG